MDGFTSLEKAALIGICELNPDERAVLQAQLATARVTSRENTGGGFFTSFSVSRDTHAVEGKRLREGGRARVLGMVYPLEFVLWFSDGYADRLEGFAVGADITSNLDFATARFEMLSSAEVTQ